MKKASLFLCCSLFMIHLISAQNFYFKIQTGKNYEFDKSGEIFMSHFITEYETYSIDTIKDHYCPYSLGKGKNQTISAGYNISRFIAFELDFSYFQGKPAAFSWVENYNLSTNSAYFLHFTYNLERIGERIDLSPSLVIHSNYHKIKPFLKIGLLCSRSWMQDELDCRLFNTIPWYVGYEHVYTQEKYDPEINLGYRISSGIEYRLTKNLDACLSFDLSQTSYQPEHSKIISYVVDNKEKLANLSRSEMEKIYCNSPDYNTSSDEPSQYLSNKVSFSSWSWNVGLKYTFLRKTPSNAKPT